MAKARDLGGLPVGADRHTRHDVVIRCGRLDDAEPAAVTAIKALRPARILDLRSPSEITTPHPFARTAAYLNLPFIDAVRDIERDPTAEQTKADVYLGSLTRNRKPIGELVTEIARVSDGPVIIHCHAGVDRTGMLCALVLDLVGVDRAAIVDDYADGTPSSARAEPGAPPGRGPATPQTMTAVLAHLDAVEGGSCGYLKTAGVSDADLARIRARLIGSSAGSTTKSWGG